MAEFAAPPNRVCGGLAGTYVMNQTPHADTLLLRAFTVPIAV